MKIKKEKRKCQLNESSPENPEVGTHSANTILGTARDYSKIPI